MNTEMIDWDSLADEGVLEKKITDIFLVIEKEKEKEWFL